MSWILLTNDDGVDSPALVPFARALARLGDVRVFAPAEERSWIGNAITRHGDIRAERVERGGIEVVAVSGYPADAVQVGAAYHDTLPDLVVSGINIGYNHGAGCIMGSGTVGAAIEGWELGLPSYAFSSGIVGDWHEWHRMASDPASTPEWENQAALCTDLLEEILAVDIRGDIVNVNVPWDANDSTPRRITTVARVTYGSIHKRVDDEIFRHDYTEDFTLQGSLEGTDVGVNKAGEISITPLTMPAAPDVSDEVRKALER
jgi:5'-nucleotidase